MDLRLVWLSFGVFTLAQADYQVPQCNPEVVKKINAYWKKSGYPNYFFNDLNVEWKVYKTTNTPLYQGANCVTYTPVGDGKLTVTRDGSSKTITATEKDGMITIEGDKDKHYLVIGTKGIIAGYHCTDNGPIEGEPDAGLTISPSASKKDIEQAEKVQASMGFKLVNTFKCTKGDC